MSNISADKIKSLREKTGAGIMDCKNALVENNGEIESSIDWLRKKVLLRLIKNLLELQLKVYWCYIKG